MLGFVDEQLATGGDDHLTDAIVEDITRQRVGEMRQIISTITPEQYALITQQPEGTLVVQGGPGTGKTAVGLHRAAWLLYADRQLAREGVLVVGPNRVFITYISQVLPALGEQSVEQRPIDALVSGRPWASGESEERATLLGQRPDGGAAVAAAVGAASVRPRRRCRWSSGASRSSATPDDVPELIAEARDRPTYEAGRERFRDRLADRLATQVMERARGGLAADPEAVPRRSGRPRSTSGWPTKCWPRQTPEALVASVFKNRRRLTGGGRRPAGARGDRPAARLDARRDARGDDAQRVRAARRGARADRPGAAHVRPRRRRRGAEPLADGAADGRPPRAPAVDHRARRHRPAHRRGAAEHVGAVLATPASSGSRSRSCSSPTACPTTSCASPRPCIRRRPCREGVRRRRGRRCRCEPPRVGAAAPGSPRGWRPSGRAASV